MTISQDDTLAALDRQLQTDSDYFKAIRYIDRDLPQLGAGTGSATQRASRILVIAAWLDGHHTERK